MKLDVAVQPTRYEQTSNLKDKDLKQLIGVIKETYCAMFEQLDKELESDTKYQLAMKAALAALKMEIGGKTSISFHCSNESGTKVFPISWII